MDCTRDEEWVMGDGGVRMMDGEERQGRVLCNEVRGARCGTDWAKLSWGWPSPSSEKRYVPFLTLDPRPSESPRPSKAQRSTTSACPHAPQWQRAVAEGSIGVAVTTGSVWLALSGLVVLGGGTQLKGGKGTGDGTKKSPPKKALRKERRRRRENLALGLTLNGGGLEILLVRVHGALSA